MRAKITIKSVKALSLIPPGGDRFLWDTDVRGFGCKLTDSGASVYIVQFRLGGRGAKTSRYTIGKHGSPWTPDMAREEALAVLRKVAAGVDPNQEKRAARHVPPDDEVSALFERFIERHHKARGNRYWPEHQRNFDHDVRPFWQGRSIKSITRRDVLDVLDRIGARGAAVQSNRVRTTLSGFFNWAVARDLIEVSPIARVPKADAERERDRVLDDDEIVRFWAGCNELGWPFGPLFKLLLLTAQRRDEVGTMEWDEIDIGKRIWVIPREKAKNNRAHEVHLSRMAVEIIEMLPKIGSDPKFIFTTNEKRPVSGFSRAKRHLDNKAALENWILHDLRRTAATGMAHLKVAPHVCDRVLNHVAGTIRGVALVYNRASYIEERQAALEAWGRYVESLVRPSSANVIPLMAAS